jgi:hypothetical protein
MKANFLCKEGGVSKGEGWQGETTAKDHQKKGQTTATNQLD